MLNVNMIVDTGIEEDINDKMMSIDENEKEAEIKQTKDKLNIKKLQPKKPLKEKEYYTYKLVGVVMHNGNAEAGHYYSYINTSRGSANNSLSPENDRWLEFNDSIISEFAFSKLEAECFGGTMEDISMGYMDENSEVAKLIGGRSKSAYMLFYERHKKDMIPLKTVITVPEEAISSSLECDGTAVSRTGNDTSNIGKTSEEIFTNNDFYEIPCIVSPELLTVL